MEKNNLVKSEEASIQQNANPAVVISPKQEANTSISKEKKKEYREVLETYVQVMQDLLIQLRINKDYTLFLIEEQKIREYVNKGVNLINYKLLITAFK